MSVSIKPLEDRIVIKQVEAETTTASGLVIPDTAKEKPQEGEVLAVGPRDSAATGSKDGSILLWDTATLTRTGRPAAQLPLARRETKDCLAEDLRRLDADEIYHEALAGMKKVNYPAGGAD